MKIAGFITAHGYGHAARSAGVMAAIHRKDPSVDFEIFTAVPGWFFEESLAGPFTHHHVQTDIGLAQSDPLKLDLTETLARLDRFLPFDPRTVRRMAEKIRHLSCRLVLCDISPLGIAVARAAGVPSVLIENFTWDWIYETYAADHPGFNRHIDFLKPVFSAADHHIQAEPVCRPAAPGLTTGPLSRKPRVPAAKIRDRLDIPSSAHAVIVTLGGLPLNRFDADRLPDPGDIFVVVPGASDSLLRKGRYRLLPHNSGIHHPDLIRACDAVISKAGYSTLAETYHAGLPLAYVPRTDFRESPVLEAFIHSHMAGVRLPDAQIQTETWMARLPEILALAPVPARFANGADKAAEFILGLTV